MLVFLLIHISMMGAEWIKEMVAEQIG